MRKTRNDLKAIFANGNRPVGQDFADLMDSSPNLVDGPPTMVQLHLGIQVVATGPLQEIAWVMRPEWPGVTDVVVLGWSDTGVFRIDLVNAASTQLWSETSNETTPRPTPLATIVAGPGAFEPLTVLVAAASGTVINIETITFLLHF